MNVYLSMKAATATLIAAAALSLVPATPASAAAPNIQRVREDSVTNTFSPKSAIAHCPAGTRVVGTGARIIGGQGQVVFEDIIPNEELTSVTVTGREDQDGFSGQWSVVAIAFCTVAPPDLELFRFPAQDLSDRTKAVTGECPGRSVLGLGVQIIDGLGQVTIESLNFAPHLVVIEDQDGNLFPWSAILYVICGNPAFSIREVASPAEFTSVNKSVTARCDSDEVVMATGVSIVQGRGQVIVDDLFTAAATPTELRVAAKEDQDGHSMVWSLRAWARCAGP